LEGGINLLKGTYEILEDVNFISAVLITSFGNGKGSTFATVEKKNLNCKIESHFFQIHSEAAQIKKDLIAATEKLRKSFFSTSCS
jgi:hypothetical protein